MNIDFHKLNENTKKNLNICLNSKIVTDTLLILMCLSCEWFLKMFWEKTLFRIAIHRIFSLTYITFQINKLKVVFEPKLFSCGQLYYLSCNSNLGSKFRCFSTSNMQAHSTDVCFKILQSMESDTLLLRNMCYNTLNTFSVIQGWRARRA